MTTSTRTMWRHPHSMNFAKGQWMKDSQTNFQKIQARFLEATNGMAIDEELRKLI
jgi:hypothetical protein